MLIVTLLMVIRLAPKGKGMQLGKKSKTTDMFERVRGDMGVSPENVSAPLTAAAPAPVASVNPGRPSLEKNAIQITVAEKISAKISREGQLKSFSVNGDLQLKISDPSLTKVKLDLNASPSHGATFRTHPKVDKALFNSSKGVQLKDTASAFPVDTSVGVLRWTVNATADASDVLPITFTVWVNKGAEDSFTVTVEYELNGDDTLNDVVVMIPFSSAEPVVASFDAIYEVTGDSLEWKIGPIDLTNSGGSFEFEAQTDDESEFFPMRVSFSKSKPLVDVDVSIAISYQNMLTLDVGRCCYPYRYGRRGSLYENRQVCYRELYYRVDSAMVYEQQQSALKANGDRRCCYYIIIPRIRAQIKNRIDAIFRCPQCISM